MAKFQGADIVEEEVRALKKLERNYDDGISLVEKFSLCDGWCYYPQLFTVKSHHVDLIGLTDPSVCEECIKFDVECRTCDLVSFPEIIANFKFLKKLYLNFHLYHALKTVPDSFKELRLLEALFIVDAKLIRLPDFIGDYKNLKYLNLNGNKLTELPESIGNLTSLQELILRSNQLSSLPDSFAKLKSLQYLDLSLNNFESLPEIIEERRYEMEIIL